MMPSFRIDIKLLDQSGIEFSIDKWCGGFKNLFLDFQNRISKKKNPKKKIIFFHKKIFFPGLFFVVDTFIESLSATK